MSAPDHLNPKARAMLGASVDDRVSFVRQPTWYGYPAAVTALGMLEEVYLQPRSSRVDHLQIVGETNNGKTWILEEFVRSKGAPFAERGDMAVVSAIAATTADEKRLWTVVLTALGGAYSHRDPPELLFQRVCTLLRNRHVHMLILDEFHESFHGTPAQRRQLLSSLKRLGNDMKLPIVVAGMPTLPGFLNLDPQVSNRFERVTLPVWDLDEGFQDLLENIESGFPLPAASELWMPEPAALIFSKTEGLVGEVFKFLRKVAVGAITDGDETITMERMRNLPWTPPSERRGLGL
jgi:hypothetical protein